ncbi:MAG TPA: alginate export family protein [Pseudomonadales bacterium]
MRTLPVYACIALACQALAPAVGAASPEPIAAAVADGETRFTLRYRHEHVDQAGFDRHANASTVRARLTWLSAAAGAWQAGIEADYLWAGTERYDSTVNGRTRYPVVADPEDFDLNQAYVTHTTQTATLTGGRQRIRHADERFVGGVGWRQNEQTFDAVRVLFEPQEALAIDYTYLANVNRVFGPEDGTQPADWRSDSHLLMANARPRPGLTLSAFGYLLDFDNDNGPLNSNATFGVEGRFTAGPTAFSASFARQTDHAANPLDYVAYYLHLEAEVTLTPATVKLGWERLGSDDGEAAFRTPLATLHLFQGWADQFLTTPDVGVRDAYLAAQAVHGPVRLTAVRHWFEADHGGADLGRELDLSLGWTVSGRLGVELKYADYRADGFASDTRKAWLTVNLSL